MTRFRFALLSLCVSVPSFASAIQYSDLGAWQAATSGVTTIDFEGIAPAGQGVNENPNFTLSGVKFAASGGGAVNLFVVSATYPGTYAFGSGDVLNAQGGNPNTTITITLPDGVTAFGFDSADSFEAAAEPALAITLSTGDQFNIFFTPTRQFFGVTSDSPFSSLTLTTTANYEGIDNVRFGQAANAGTPEPASLLLIGTALLGIGLARKRGPVTFSSGSTE